MTTVIVSGALANKPGNGGAAWTRLSYVLGLRRLGLNAHFVEQIDPEHTLDDAGSPTSFDASVNRRHFRRSVAALGLSGSAALVFDGGRAVEGATFSDVCELAGSADLLINVSGHLTLTPMLRGIRHKVYVDLDPGYTQFWHAQGVEGARLQGHDAYFTVGTNIGRSDCLVPPGDIRWFPTLPPTVLGAWPVVDPPAEERFTTVASWRGPYGRVVDGDRTYGLKVHEFRRFVDLPSRVPTTLEVALDIHPDDHRDRETLIRGGWHLADPAEAIPDPFAFRRYVQGSSAEFSVAQGIYVETRSGWFSDRTARYLASGRPAVVQDTGIDRTLPVGEGLLTFRDPAEAEARIRDVVDDPERHAKAARALAEEYLDSDAVLGRMLEIVGVSP
jgi:hypothetical protein